MSGKLVTLKGVKGGKKKNHWVVFNGVLGIVKHALADSSICSSSSYFIALRVNSVALQMALIHGDTNRFCLVEVQLLPHSLVGLCCILF